MSEVVLGQSHLLLIILLLEMLEILRSLSVMALIVSMAGTAGTWSVKYRHIMVFGYGMFIIRVNLFAATPDSIVFIFLDSKVVAPLAAN